MNRSSLSGTPPEEGAPKGIMCMFQPAPADHLAGSRALGAPTEVVYTPLRVPSLSLARFAQKPTPLGAASAPLCSCSGARGSSSKGIKNPEGLGGTSGRRYGTFCVPVRRCLGSSMLPLSRLGDGLTVVNASLAQRTPNYTASRARRQTGLLSPAASPPESAG
jgi:hypothetical protein